MLHTFTVSAVNTPAKAKIVFNKKLGTVRVVVAFNTHKRIVNNVVKETFPVQSKCAFVSGDLLVADVVNALALASKTLNTTNIVVVD
jgi:hypothetical protein